MIMATMIREILLCAGSECEEEGFREKERRIREIFPFSYFFFQFLGFFVYLSLIEDFNGATKACGFGYPMAC